MRLFVANHQSPGLLVVSRHPLKQNRTGFILCLAARGYEDQPESAASVHQDTKLAPSEGAILDVRRFPRKGYMRVEFTGCEEGTRRVLGVLPRSTGEERWVIYAKVLKREFAPRPVTF
jgi:hypothetical protein